MTWNKFFISSFVTVLATVSWLSFKDIQSFNKADFVSFAFLPGPLSKSHAFLENQCTICHTPNQGVTAVGCISCHSNNSGLLQRQSTAFHANVTSCKQCHQEHQGGVRPKVQMDHLALAKLAVADLEKNPKESALISSLNCVTCHASKDKHQGKFGTTCLNCHSSVSWSISEYKHPSTNSRDCAQCHQEPPSHRMMHFEMISKTVSGQKQAKANQCFLCHQTTSWNDIKGKGWYKHH